MIGLVAEAVLALWCLATATTRAFISQGGNPHVESWFIAWIRSRMHESGKAFSSSGAHPQHPLAVVDGI